MSYETAEVFDQIIENESQLHHDLKNRSLTVKEYLERDRKIDQQMRDIGEVFESLGDLENRLLLVMDKGQVSEVIERRGMCAALSKKYEIQSRYVFIEYDDVNYLPEGDSKNDTSNGDGQRIDDVIQRVIITQYINFEDIAKSWSLKEIEDFIEYTSNIFNYSPDIETD